MDVSVSQPSCFFPLIQSKEFISALAGALVGGVFALAGTWLGACFERRKRAQESQELVRSTLEAISTEVEVLFSRYMKTMGCIITALAPDKVLNMYYSVTEEYFTVFDNNAKLLGQLKNKELRSSIISTYIDMKGLIEGFRLNNGRIKEYEIFRSNDRAAPASFVQAKLQEIMLLRKNMTDSIKSEHNKLIVQIPKLISDISDNISRGTY